MVGQDVVPYGNDLYYDMKCLAWTAALLSGGDKLKMNLWHSISALRMVGLLNHHKILRTFNHKGFYLSLSVSLLLSVILRIGFVAGRRFIYRTEGNDDIRFKILVQSLILFFHTRS